jgi:hypothetical protein
LKKEDLQDFNNNKNCVLNQNDQENDSQVFTNTAKLQNLPFQRNLLKEKDLQDFKNKKKSDLNHNDLQEIDSKKDGPQCFTNTKVPLVNSEGNFILENLGTTKNLQLSNEKPLNSTRALRICKNKFFHKFLKNRNNNYKETPNDSFYYDCNEQSFRNLSLSERKFLQIKFMLCHLIFNEKIYIYIIGIIIIVFGISVFFRNFSSRTSDFLSPKPT